MKEDFFKFERTGTTCTIFKDVKLFANVLYFLLKLGEKKQHGTFNECSKGLRVHVGSKIHPFNLRNQKVYNGQWVWGNLSRFLLLLFGVLHVWKGSIYLFILRLPCPRLAVQLHFLPSLRPVGCEKGEEQISDEEMNGRTAWGFTVRIIIYLLFLFLLCFTTCRAL